MNVFSATPIPSSSSSSNYALFSPQIHSPIYFCSPFPFNNLHHSSLLHPIFSHDVSSSSSISTPQQTNVSSNNQEIEELLVVRRPVMENQGSEDDEDDEKSDYNKKRNGVFVEEEIGASSLAIDATLSNIAKKFPIFEPQRMESVSGEKPLLVNLDLALYRAKILARNYQFQEAELILQKCIYYWPEDGRPYVALGKILSKQMKTEEARAVYERGSQATQGENSYIWQCWAVLENKVGNVRRARKLFDAATVANKRHIAAWHGWAILELKQGNINKARHLLGKGLKHCGGNEYVYQTLALLEAKSRRYERARYLFKQATKCNPKSCASWLAWAQLEAQQENIGAARQLFEKAVQASPKNRFAWHVWGVFESNLGNIDLGRKLLKIGHIVNPRDPVLLQSLALLEYKSSSPTIARTLFKRASEIDPRHQPVWIAWGWMEWKEGNISTARELYQRALSIDSTSESAARCLQAWGVLEQGIGNYSAAKRLFRSSIDINSQSYVTWMTWAALEEKQGNLVRAEEIRNFYVQQHTEVVDDASWIMGFIDVIDPAIDSIKRLLNLDQNVNGATSAVTSKSNEEVSTGSSSAMITNTDSGSEFDLDNFVREKLSLDPTKLEILFMKTNKYKTAPTPTPTLTPTPNPNPSSIIPPPSTARKAWKLRKTTLPN